MPLSIFTIRFIIHFPIIRCTIHHKYITINIFIIKNSPTLSPKDHSVQSDTQESAENEIQGMNNSIGEEGLAISIDNVEITNENGKHFKYLQNRAYEWE